MFYSLSTNDIHKRMNTTDRQGNPKQQLNTQRQTHTNIQRERDTYTHVNNETDCDLYLLVGGNEKRATERKCTDSNQSNVYRLWDYILIQYQWLESRFNKDYYTNMLVVCLFLIQIVKLLSGNWSTAESSAIDKNNAHYFPFIGLIIVFFIHFFLLTDCIFRALFLFAFFFFQFISALFFCIYNIFASCFHSCATA